MPNRWSPTLYRGDALGQDQEDSSDDEKSPTARRERRREKKKRANTPGSDSDVPGQLFSSMWADGLLDLFLQAQASGRSPRSAQRALRGELVGAANELLVHAREHSEATHKERKRAHRRSNDDPNVSAAEVLLQRPQDPDETTSAYGKRQAAMNRLHSEYVAPVDQIKAESRPPPALSRSSGPKFSDRVGYQKLYNADLRDKGFSHYADQGIGFDQTGKPFDKSTQAISQQGGEPSRSQQLRATTQPCGNDPPPSDSSSSSDSDVSTSSSDEHRDEAPRVNNPQRSMPDRRRSQVPPATRQRNDLDVYGWDRNQLGELPKRSPYLSDIHKKYRQMIREQVGKPLGPNPLNTKQLKLPHPAEYTGEEDIEKFDGWLQSLLRWMKLSNMTGPDNESGRIAVTAMFLAGKARQWFNDNVEGVARQRKHWSFTKVITGLYDRFIHEVSIQDATTKFYSLKYTKDNGASGFYHDLDRYARRMIHPPDEYTFKTQFMMGLPHHLLRDVIGKGVTAETSDLLTIVQLTRRMEQVGQIQANYDDRRKAAAGSIRTAKPAIPPRSAVAVAHTQSMPTNSDKRQSRSLPPKRKHYPQDKRPSGSTQPPARVGTQSRTPHNGDKRTSDTKCFKCGAPGHFASDPKCPQFGKVRMAAIQEGEDAIGNNDIGTQPMENAGQEIAGQEAETAPDESNYRLVVEEESPDEHLEGSQYTSEGENYPLESYEEYGDRTDTDDEQMCAIREETLRASVECAKEHISSLDENRLSTNRDTTLTMRKSHTQKPRPEKKAELIRPLMANIMINGLSAIAMLDTGSTADAITPGFARVANLKIFELTEPVGVQLGTKGSRSRIVYGTVGTVQFSTINTRHYLDIVNVDKYDAIIGIGFMRKHNIVLDPAANEIRVNGTKLPAMTSEEFRTEIAQRQSLRREQTTESH